LEDSGDVEDVVESVDVGVVVDDEVDCYNIPKKKSCHCPGQDQNCLTVS